MQSRHSFWRHAIAVAAAMGALLGGPGLRAQAPEAAVQNYTIGAQDVLTISSLDEAALTGPYSVQADGTLTFPYIGTIKAAGLTVHEFELALKKQLVDKGYFNNPQLSVAVAQYRSQHVYVMGEVRAPGSYPLTGGMKLIEAIALAGAVTPQATGDVVVVRPKSPDVAQAGPVVPGMEAAADAEVIHVDLIALQNGAFDKNLALRDGDTVFVPRAASVYVFGEVKNPNAYPLPRNTTVMQAITLAGGPTPDAAMNRVTIVRAKDGKTTEIKVGDPQTEPVESGDTIKVPTRWF